MHSFEFRCHQCGRVQDVTAVQAGMTLQCLCGSENLVPPLSELRRQAGMAAFEKSTSDTILEMVSDGRLPPGPGCVDCGTVCDERPLVALCERVRLGTSESRGQWSGGFIAGILGGLPFFLPLGSWTAGEVREQQLGRDVVVPMPVRICDRCWEQSTGRSRNAVFGYLAAALAAVVAVLLVLWALKPFIGVEISPTGIVAALAAAILAWVAKRRSTAESAAAVKALLSKVPVYRDLCREYPHAQIVEGQLHEYSDMRLPFAAFPRGSGRRNPG